MYDDEVLVGAGRLTIHDSLEQAPDGTAIGPLGALLPPNVTIGPLGVLSRLVVRPSHRRQGIASALNRHRLAHALYNGVTGVVVSVVRDDPRDQALARSGFRAIGETSIRDQLILAPVRLYLADPVDRYSQNGHRARTTQ